MGERNVRRWRAGFTLAEVMVVVALIVILAAIAVPSVLALRRNLKMTELDSCAKDIFIAAQSSLTGLKSRNTLTLLKDGTPTGTPEEGLYYLRERDPAMKNLLPTGAIDGIVAAKDYVIVFDAASATVLDVYYSEENLSADEAIALRDDPDGRRKQMIGYYGGSNIVSVPSGTKDLPTPILTLENAADLTANVKLDLSDLDAATIAQLSLKLTLSDGARSQELSFGPLDIAGGDPQPLILDSLTDTQFQTSCSSLAPGADITAIATLSYNGTSHTYLPANSAQVTANSLFASRNGDTVTLSYPRHLQNLDELTSGVVPQITGAVLERRIDWPESVNLIPIENPALTRFNGGEHVISGLKIVPRTSAAPSPAGLFGALRGAQPITLENIRIENATLSNITGGPSGLLAGMLKNVQVDNCFVYVVNNQSYSELASTYPVSGNGDLGGLIGLAEDCTVSYSAAGLPVLFADSQINTRVGGLIGRATNCPSITNCYAVVDQIDGQAIQAAMFIGRAENVPVITSCYAVGNIQVVTPYANQTGDLRVSQISGFMNNNPAAKLKDCYAAVTYLDEKGKDRDITIMYSFAPERKKQEGGALSNCAYLTTGVKVYNTVNQEGDATEYSNLTKWRGSGFAPSTDVKNAFPYRDELRGKPYPFPLLNSQTGEAIPHRGSWPLKPKLSTLGSGLAYLEAYADGSYGVYSVDQTGVVWNSLKDGADIVVEHSNAEKALPTYGILLDKGTTLESLGTASFAEANSNDTSKVTVDKLFHTGQGNVIQMGDKVFYPFKNSVIRDLNEAIYDDPQFSTKFWFDSNPNLVFYLNPNFAAGVATSLGTDQSPWSEEHPLQVRTDEQLFQACSTPGDQVHVLQTHDIDASDMADTSNLEINDNRYFDGNGYQITGLKHPLFGKVTLANLKNVTIVDAQISDGNTGIFARSLNGTIQVSNCTVKNSTIHGRSNVAGFAFDVGQNVVIEDCAVSGTTVTATSGSAAGFVFQSAGKITSSHAQADVTGSTAAGFVYDGQTEISSSYFNGTVRGTTAAAGFVYNCAYGAAQIENCYAAGTITAPKAYGFATEYFKPFRNAYAAVVLNGTESYGFAKTGHSVGTVYYMAQNGLTAQGQTGHVITDVTKWKALADTMGAAIWETSPTGFPALRGNPHVGNWPNLPEVTE